MTTAELERLAKQLRHPLPLIGAGAQRKACQALAAEGGAAMIPHLLWALTAKDAQVRATAEAALRGLRAGPAPDALFDLAIADPAGMARRFCQAEDLRPADHDRACAYLFVTGQLDAYFQEDFEFQSLRMTYEHASAGVREQVMEVVRSGDRRCLGFFGGKRRPLSECSEEEVRLAIDSALRHQDWARLFRAVLDLPLKHSLPLFPAFRKAGWTPVEPEVEHVYTQLLEDTANAQLPKPDPNQPQSSVFATWLAAGRVGELPGLPEAELLKRLEASTPPDGVKLVAALATKVKPNSPAAQQILGSPHWLVRLAGHAGGLSQDITRDSVQDASFWVKELAGSTAVLEMWPAHATPADLDRLNAAPAEAWTGKLGAARQALRTLLAYRVTTGVLEELVVEGGEFAAEFEEA